MPARVLIAHFDPEQRAQLESLLRAVGAEVVAAADGPGALEVAGDFSPTLALLSSLLPGVNGFEVCRRLCAGANPPAVILLTDMEDPYVRARGRHVGAKRVEVEPISPERLQEILDIPWEVVDPLEMTSKKSADSGERLLRDLMGAGRDSRPPALIAKVSDSLTGLVNEEYLGMKQEEELKRAARYKQPLSLLVLEVSNFDDLVGRFGRAAGDEALLEVASVFLCESRDVDVAARVGRARFQLLLPNTPAAGTAVVAERVRANVEERTLVFDGTEVPLEITVAHFTMSGERSMNREDFVQDATRALDEARRVKAGS